MKKILLKKLLLKDKTECLKFFEENCRKFIKTVNITFAINNCLNLSNENGYGLKLINHKKKMVGYLGFLNGNIKINNSTLQTINLTDWYICEKYRSHTFKFMKEIMTYKQTVITCQSPIPETQKLFETLGFKLLDTSERTYHTIKGVKAYLTKKHKIYNNEEAIKRIPDNYERKLFENHFKLGCQVVLIKYESQKLWLILLKANNLLQLIHVNQNLRNLDNVIWEIVLGYCFIKEKVFYFKIDNRFTKLKFNPKIIKERKCYYYSKKKINFLISRAYSEPLNKFVNTQKCLF